MSKKKLRISLCLISLLILGSTAQSAEILTKAQKSMAINTIKGYPEVKDAAITQEKQKLSLVLVVTYATTEARGKKLGDNFVRLVKTFGPEKSPGKEIGKGEYDYLIGIYYANEKQLALGAKVSFSPRITW